MGNRGGGSPREDANPDGDATNDGFLGLGLFFFCGRFVELDLLETDKVYTREENLEILVSKLYETMNAY